MHNALLIIFAVRAEKGLKAILLSYFMLTVVKLKPDDRPLGRIYTICAIYHKSSKQHPLLILCSELQWKV